MSNGQSGWMPLVYLDTGEIFVADEEGWPVPDSLVAFTADEMGAEASDKYGTLFAAAPDLADLGQFLADRLTDIDGVSSDPELFVRDFYGHVAPALSRFQAALAKARGQS